MSSSFSVTNQSRQILQDQLTLHSVTRVLHETAFYPDHDKLSAQLAKEIPLPAELRKGPIQVTLD